MSSAVKNFLWLLALAAVSIVLVLALREDVKEEVQTAPPPEKVAETNDPVLAEAVLEMAKRKELDATVWTKEIKAQEYEETLIAFWDGIRNAADKFAFVRDFPVPWLDSGKEVGRASHAHEIERTKFSGGGVRWDRNRFKEWLDGLELSQLEIVQSEWHHKQFLPGGEGPDASVVNFTVHARRTGIQQRLALSGDLRVTWSTEKDGAGRFAVAEVAVVKMDLLTRTGPPAFREVRLATEPEKDVIPLSVLDLNDDGWVDVFFLQHNVVYWNRGDMKFERGVLFATAPGDVSAEEFSMIKVNMRSVFGDFTGDGILDAMVGLPRHGLFVYPGDSEGSFSLPARPVFNVGPEETLDHLSALTAGDIDGDGDLDVWVTQYRVPYDQGFLPVPYYSATNGYPSYLLVNDGKGGFTDGTVAAGLAVKRTRLTLSASFHDIDRDGDLDLLNVADYCGADVYRNDGAGRFTDVTDELLDVPHTFGMGHTFGDFNGDAKLDLYVTGMGSTTARRLEALGLKRPGQDQDNVMRMKMGYGNRMFLGGRREKMPQPGFRDRVARSGWSWGCASLDFGNDGALDMYVANGFISAGSCKDYCTRFWTHDVYHKGIEANPVMDAVHNLEWNEDGMSWNGYEKNVLFVNEGGTNFFNAGFLMDMGFVYDSRTVVAEDFDRDGRMDLGVVELDTSGRVGGNQEFHLYQNVWPKNGAWIGVVLRGVAGISTLGAIVTVETDIRKFTDVVVSGDSYFAQQSRNVHFGIGQAREVRAIHVDWINGGRTTLRNPEIGRYHRIVATR